MTTYADKPWIKRYDSNVPASLKPYPEHSIHDYLRQNAQKFPSRPLTVSTAKLPLVGRQSKILTYKEIDELSDAMAAALVNTMGLKKGDRVVLVMPNCAQFVIAFFGILKAGGVVVANNPTYPADKMKHQINDSNAKVVITLSLFYNMIKELQPDMPSVQHVIVTNIKEYLPPLAAFLFGIAKEKKEGHAIEKKPQDHWFQDVLKQHTGQKVNVPVSKEDVALFQYTGGTTGVSKAAMASHGGIVANAEMCGAWLFGRGQRDERIFLGAIPMFHVFGLVAVVTTATALGSRIILVPNARDIEEVLQCIHTYRCSVFPGVPALYNAINNNENVKAGKYDLSSIKICISGSAPLAPSTKNEFERITGGSLIEGFGMSEAPTATHANPIQGENRTGSIGLPFPDVEIKIVSLDDPDVEVPIGEVGELCIHGPQLMSGYHNMPTETQNVLRKDASGKTWLTTGDIARMDDDGYFYIVDRKKDMALIGGFNVYPRVVEDVLMEHPAVREVGVAAIPHPEKIGQESLKAWVALHPDQSVTEKDLVEFAATKLARYEIPTRFEFVQELPRTAIGKVLRRELARMEIEAREKPGKSS